MDCMHCGLKIPHSHLTKEDHDYIALLYKKADQIIDKPLITDPKFDDKMADRKNKLMWWVNEELIRMGKRVKFPVPEKPYEKYI